MKSTFSIFIAFLFVTLTACGQVKEVNSVEGQFPKPVGLINDFDNLFSDEEERILNSLVTDFEARTSIEIAVVTLVKGTSTKEDFNSYNLQLANAWGVGKKDKDNGVLICIANSIQTVRINNGLGIEKVLTDSETKTIIDNFMVPEFRKGSYFGGAKNGILELIRKLE